MNQTQLNAKIAFAQLSIFLDEKAYGDDDVINEENTLQTLYFNNPFGGF